MIRKWIKRFFILGIIGAIALVVLFFAVFYGAFGPLPTRGDLKAVQVPNASIVYADDGSVLGKFYVQNRSNVRYKDISKYIINALVATEDARFFKHKGLDGRSYMRVLVKTIFLRNRASGGGSTISQQLIKNLYKRQNYSILTLPVNKIKEAIVAKRLEDVYSKEDILELYLNTVPFGELAFGIGTASQRFFGKKPKDVTLEEAATLIGLLKATTYYSPRVNPQQSKERRNMVLALMAKENYITGGEKAVAQSRDLKLNYSRVKPNEGPAPYFMASLKKELKKWTSDNPKTNGDSWNIFTDGMKIYTTIDKTMQKYAEEAARTHLKDLQKIFDKQWTDDVDFFAKNYNAIETMKRRSNRYRKMKDAGKSEAAIIEAFKNKRPMKLFSYDGPKDRTISPYDSIAYYLKYLQTGFVAMDPENGHVKAWVGGVDYNYFTQDHALEGRHVGSTFKPLVYATALTQGKDPCSYYQNQLVRYPDYQDWTPENADGKYGGWYSFQGALANSVNTVTVQVLFEAGVDQVINFAKSLGIKSDLPKVPSICLGTADIKPLEMVSAYCAFANGGYQTEPFYLKKITDSDGKVIKIDKAPAKSLREKVIDDKTVNTMTNILKKVVNDGTGKRLRWQFGLTNEIAGKTGTTQEQSDGWFIGYTPNLVAGVWVGAEDRRVSFRTLTDGQGSRTALPIWGHFMKKLAADSRYAAKVTQPFTNYYYADVNSDCILYSQVDPTIPVAPPPSTGGTFDHIFNRKPGETRVTGGSRSTGGTKTQAPPKVTKPTKTVKTPPAKPKKSILERIFGGRNERKKSR